MCVESFTYLFDLRHPDVLPEIAENEINTMSNTSIFINMEAIMTI